MKKTSKQHQAKPSVTILIASFNRLKYLEAAVASALQQQYPEFDILIVDDGSSTGVVDWLQALAAAESRVSVIYQKHQGVAAARANGVLQAAGELVCILDSDDSLVETALPKLVDAITGREDARLVFCNIREVRGSGDAAICRYRQYDSTQSMLIATLLRPRVPFKHSGTLFCRQTALELGSYDRALSCKVDVDLYLKFLEAGYLPVHVDEALVDFRMHKNSVSIDRMAGIKVWLYLIDRYGPGNPAQRLFIKGARVGAELLKRVYIEFRG